MLGRILDNCTRVSSSELSRGGMCVCVLGPGVRCAVLEVGDESWYAGGW